MKTVGAGLSGNILKLNLFAFLKMTLFPMAVITLFWKDHIGLSLTEILMLQGLFSVASVLMEYPSGYLNDRLGYRASILSLHSLTFRVGFIASGPLIGKVADTWGLGAAFLLLAVLFALLLPPAALRFLAHLTGRSG